MRLILAIIVAFSALAFGTPVQAHTVPTGTIAIDPSSTLVQGGHAVFDYSVEGAKRSGVLSIHVFCFQYRYGTQRNITYDQTQLALANDFVLDSSNWISGESADCRAILQYAFHPNTYSYPLAQVDFTTASP